MLLVGFALMAPSLPLWATPPGDPICGVPSSLQPVLAIRAKLAEEAKVRRQLLRLQQAASLPRLSIEHPDPFDLPRLILGGPAGQTCELEASSDPASGK